MLIHIIKKTDLWMQFLQILRFVMIFYIVYTQFDVRFCTLPDSSIAFLDGFIPVLYSSMLSHLVNIYEFTCL